MKRTKRAVADVVFAYRHIIGEPNKPLSFRDFAAQLSDVLSAVNHQVSHQTVKNWEDRTHLPRIYSISALLHQAPNDWRRDFAEDMLAVIRPNLYQPATDIGHRALKRSLTETGPHKLRYDTRYLQI